MLPVRLFPLDALRALAAQLIVLHHLSVYGPLAEALHRLAPRLTGWLFDDARMAVQIFLVMGGYLSARALTARHAGLHRHAMALLAQRYWRLVPPFMAAVALTLAASWLMQPVLPELMPAQISAAQLLAHALLLHDLLGMEALTVGAWYVAIDFQLFALLLIVMAAARGLPAAPATRLRWGMAAVGVLCAASLWVANRVTALDVHAIYFFGSYGLGALLFWSQGFTARKRYMVWGAMAVVTLGALALEFRERLVVAAAAVVVMAAWRRADLPGAVTAAVQGAAKHAYALFLVHFAVCLVVNAGFEVMGLETAWEGWALVAAGLAWGLSNLAAVPFYRWVEAPLLQWRPEGAGAPLGRRAAAPSR